MKKAFKIMGVAFLSFVVFIGGVFLYAFVKGELGDKNINIRTLEFAPIETLHNLSSAENPVYMTVSDFDASFTFLPEDANRLDVTLSVQTGKNVVELENEDGEKIGETDTVKANEKFRIKIKTNPQTGLPYGGLVQINATSGLAVSTKTLAFWVDVEIPTDGLLLVSNYDETLLAGGDEFDIYAYTNPNISLFPDSRTNINAGDIVLNKAYKNVSIATSANNLQIINKQGLTGEGWLRTSNDLTKPIVFERTVANQVSPEGYSNTLIRFKKFRVKPNTSSVDNVSVNAKVLRTYFMEQDFVDINDVKYQKNITQAYADFSAYLEKYKSYIIADKRVYDQNDVRFENGEAFINSVTREVNGQQIVSLDSSSINNEWQVAMFYLYINSSKTYAINDVEIGGLHTNTSTSPINLHTEKQYNVAELINNFGVEVTALEGTFTNDIILAKIAQIKISSLKTVDNNNDNQPDTDESGELVLVSASDELLVINPQDNPNHDPANPIWTIRALNPANRYFDEFYLEFKITENRTIINDEGQSEVVIVEFKDLTRINIDYQEVEEFTFGDLPEDMVINERLNDNQHEQKTFVLDDGYYSFGSTTPTYKTVKYFVTEDSAFAFGKPVIRLSQNYTSKRMTMLNSKTNSTINAYEIDYYTDEGLILEAINIPENNKKVQIFAGVIKTDYNGDPVLDAEGDYILVAVAYNRPFNITAYIDTLNFYTLNEQTGIYTKRTNDFKTVNLLSNYTYKFYVTNLELDAYGDFNDRYEGYSNQNINYQYNLTYALRKDAYGDNNNRNEFIKFGKELFSTFGDSGVLKIETGQGKETYTYNEQTNMISIEVTINPRKATDNLVHVGSGGLFEPSKFIASAMGTHNLVSGKYVYVGTGGNYIPTEFEYVENATGSYTINNTNNLPTYSFNIFAEYKDINPVDIRRTSSIGVNVVFASLKDNVQINNSTGITAGEIELYATAQQGQTDWIYYETNQDQEQTATTFAIEDLFYEFDIFDYVNGTYSSSKIDTSFNSSWFMQGCYKEVSIGGNYNFVSGEYVRVTEGLGTHVFVSGYLQNLLNYVKVVWSTDNSEFAEVNIDAEGNPVLNIKKGTPQGEKVTITATVYTYKDAGIYFDDMDRYLQQKQTSLTIVLIQEQPEPFLYTVQERQVNGQIEEFLIKNSGTEPLILDGGYSFNLLKRFDSNLKVYEKDSEDQNTLIPVRKTIINPDGSQSEIDVQSQYLIDVKFTDTDASIVGDLTFEIQSGQGTPFIYFLNDNVKTYTQKPRKVLDNDSYYFELLLYTENATNPKLEEIRIVTPFGESYSYHVKIESNINITIPVNKNISGYDNVAINLNNEVVAKQNVPVGNNVFEEIRLPISFELTGAASVNYAKLSAETNNIYNVNQTDKGNFAYYQNSFGNVIRENNLLTRLTPFQVLDTKYLDIKFYYFVPKLDEQKQIIHVTENSEILYKNAVGEFVLRVENQSGEIEEQVYTGTKYFLYEKTEYKVGEGFNKIEIRPSVTVKLGTNVVSPIEVKSGLNGFELYKVKGNRLNPTTTNFIDVIDVLNENNLKLPNNLQVNPIGFEFDYSEIYKQYFKISFDRNSLNEQDKIIFDELNPQISELGIVSSNSINKNLTVDLIITKLEGELVNGKPVLTGQILKGISIKFLNSVNFNVSEKLLEGRNYVNQNNAHTQNPVGHVYSSANQITTRNELGSEVKVLTVADKVVELYNSENAGNVNLNYINILGGNEEDLLNAYLTNLIPYYHDGTTFVELENFSNIDFVWDVTTQGITNSIKLILKGTPNKNTHYMFELHAEEFGLVGKYYFTVVSNIGLEINYPINSNYELVTNGTEVDLHTSYINNKTRVLIKQDVYTSVAQNTGDYILEFGLIYRYVGLGLGNYLKSVQYFTLNYNGQNKIVLKNETTNEEIFVEDNYAGIGRINFYKYDLLNSNKNIVSTLPFVNGTYPVVSNNRSQGVVSFKNITTNSTAFVRITLFNGAFIDYEFRAQSNIIKENIRMLDANSNEITINNPLPVYAVDTQLNLFNFIELQNGELSKLMVLYNGFDLVKAYLKNEVTNEFNVEAQFNTLIAYNRPIIFENITNDVVVSFKIFGANFTSGDLPYVLYVKVLKNFVVEKNNNLSIIPAGVETKLIKTSTQTGIFNIAKGNDSDVEIKIEKINDLPYDENNIYGAKLTQNGTHFTIDNLQSRIKIEFSVVKHFTQNLKTPPQHFTFDVVPNIKVTPSYNNPNHLRHEITSPAISSYNETNDNYGLEFSFSDNVTITDYSSNNLKEHDEVSIEYFISSQQNGVGYKNFNSTIGKFDIMPVNEPTQISVGIKIRWTKNNKTVEYTFMEYNVLVLVNIDTMSVVYSNQDNKTINVFAGQSKEVNFEIANNSVKFANDGEFNVLVNIKQLDKLGISKAISFYTLNQDNDDYVTFVKNEKHYITFKQNISETKKVLIPIYADLTNTKPQTRFVENVLGLYNTGLFVEFTVESSVKEFSYKTEFEGLATSNGALTVDFGKPTYESVAENAGDFVYNETLFTYEYVGEQKGNYVLKQNYQGYSFVGLGLGDYILTNHYEYAGENEGSYKPVKFEASTVGTYDLVNEVYVYVGKGGTHLPTEFELEGEFLGDYNLIVNHPKQVENGKGDYVKLEVNQYDLFAMFNLSLKSGLTLNGSNKNALNEFYLRKSLKFTVVSGQSNVVVNQLGIATFKTTQDAVLVQINVHLLSEGNQTKPLYFNVLGGQVIVVKLLPNSSINSLGNPFTIKTTDTKNIKDYFNYGYVLNYHLNNANSSLGAVNLNIDSLKYYNVSVRVDENNQEIVNLLTYVKLNNGLVTPLVITGSEFVSLDQDGNFIFNNVPNDESVNVTISVLGTRIYFKVNK